MTNSTAYSEAKSTFEELIEELRRHADNPKELWDIEQLVDKKGQEVLKLLIQGYLNNLANEEEVRDDVVGEDGTKLPHVRERSRKVMTLYGKVEEKRLGYSAHGTESSFPLDEVLNVPPTLYSHTVEERIAYMVANEAYDETVDQMILHTGARVHKRQAEDVSRRVAGDFEPFYLARQKSAPYQSEQAFIILTLDGKGIVMRYEDLLEATRKRAESSTHKYETRLSRGEKRNRKRNATVAAVYGVDAHLRTAEQIMDKEKRAEMPPAPKPVDKRVWASVKNKTAIVLDQMIAEAKRRDPENKLPWVFLVDGQEEQLRQVREAMRRHNVKATIIQDFIHVLEYLWRAVTSFHEEGTPAAERWVKDRALAILQGKASNVAAGMRRSATRKNLSKAARKPVDTCRNYLIKNKKRLRYHIALKRGMPIATGVIEGACRHLVKRRMEISGARWSLEGAEAVLRLRALRMSGDWVEYCAYHRQQERLRNYVESK
jgi:hypothetical protein